MSICFSHWIVFVFIPLSVGSRRSFKARLNFSDQTCTQQIGHFPYLCFFVKFYTISRYTSVCFYPIWVLTAHKYFINFIIYFFSDTVLDVGISKRTHRTVIVCHHTGIHWSTARFLYSVVLELLEFAYPFRVGNRSWTSGLVSRPLYIWVTLPTVFH